MKTGRRIALAAVSVLAASGAIVSLVRGNGGARPRTVEATVEFATVAALAPAGGVVRQVIAKPGEPVEAGQILARFDAATLMERRGALAASLDSAGRLSKLPRAAAAVAVESHPDVIAVEDEYVRAAAAFEQGKASRAELERAAAARMETRHRVAAAFGRSTASVSSTIATLESMLRELDRLIAEREVRAPAAGMVAILDLHPGDRVLPGGPVALLRVPGQYTCEFVPPGGVDVEPGSTLRGRAGNVRVAAQVDKIVKRPVPSALREDRSIAEETIVRVRFSSAAPLAAGSVIRLELPQ